MIDINSIIKGCLDKDRASQRALYDWLGPKLYPVCLRYTQTVPDAQDCLQDTFVRIFKYLHSYKKQEGASFVAWAKKIAVNIAIRSIQKKNPLKESFELNNEITESDKRDDASSNLIENDWVKVLDELSESKRIIFNLYVVEGYNHAEIADLLEISEGTSKSQLSRAKEQLRIICKGMNMNE